MTDIRTLRLNFIVATLLLGTATALLMVFGAASLTVYVATGNPIAGGAIFTACLIIAAGCMLALLRIATKLRTKIAEAKAEQP